MTGNRSKEIEMITRINRDIQNLITDLNIVVSDMGILSQLIYENEVAQCGDDIDIKLQSHM